MSNKSCRLLPHGGYTLIPATLSTMAWVASLSQDGCDYARISGASVSSITGSDVVPYIEIGLNGFRQPTYDPTTGAWEVDISSECSELPNTIDMDVYWTLTKSFAFLALVFGGGASLFLWFTSCLVFGPDTWRWAGYEVLIACLFQSLTFLWFNNSLCSNTNVCSLYFGSRADIVASAFWFVSTVAIFMKYPFPEDERKSALALAADMQKDGVFNEVGEEDSIMSDPDPGTKFPRADLV